MAPLIAVGGVDAGADQPVADIKAAFKGSFDVAAVVGVEVDRVVGPSFLAAAISFPTMS